MLVNFKGYKMQQIFRRQLFYAPVVSKYISGQRLDDVNRMADEIIENIML